MNQRGEGREMKLGRGRRSGERTPLLLLMGLKPLQGKSFIEKVAGIGYGVKFILRSGLVAWCTDSGMECSGCI